MPEDLTIKEAAEIAEVHPHTIRNYIRRGVLPAYKWGGISNTHHAWRIKKEDLEIFMKGGK